MKAGTGDALTELLRTLGLGVVVAELELDVVAEFMTRFTFTVLQEKSASCFASGATVASDVADNELGGKSRLA